MPGLLAFWLLGGPGSSHVTKWVSACELSESGWLDPILSSEEWKLAWRLEAGRWSNAFCAPLASYYHYRRMAKRKLSIPRGATRRSATAVRE
jgi:carboxypeptidase C (cathepsin A)